MATEKLAEGIRAFDSDARKLGALIAALPARGRPDDGPARWPYNGLQVT
jgi:hypothetical protein